MHYLLSILLLISCDQKKPELDRDGLAAEAEAEPLAYITGLPTGVSDIASIDAEVRGNVTQYKYAFMTDAGVACKDAEYGEFRPLSTRLMLDLGVDGDKVICLIGKDSEGSEQKKPERYQWEKISIASSQLDDISLEQADVNDDGKIDDSDLDFVRTNQGETIDDANRAADVDENGVIDQIDIAAVGYRFGGEKCLKPDTIARADVNGDLKINIQDLVLVAGYQGKKSLTTDAEKKADVCEDGQIGKVDLVAVSYWFGEEKCSPEVEVARTDVNVDGVINILDLVLVARHQGKNSLITAEEKKVDVCEDGVIGMKDLHTVSHNFGKTVPQ